MAHTWSLAMLTLKGTNGPTERLFLKGLGFNPSASHTLFGDVSENLFLGSTQSLFLRILPFRPLPNGTKRLVISLFPKLFCSSRLLRFRILSFHFHVTLSYSMLHLHLMQWVASLAQQYEYVHEDKFPKTSLSQRSYCNIALNNQDKLY